MSTHYAVPDLEAEKREEEMRLLKCENDRLRTKIQSMLHEVQKYQTAGSPPPGDETMLIRWIMDTLRAKNARLEDANSRLRSLNAQLISAGNEMEFALVRLACGGIMVVEAWRKLVNGE